jgi:hypothetical protein
VDRETEGGFQDLLALEARTEAQEEAGHPARQLPRELGPSPPEEEVDDREVVGFLPGGQERLGPRPGQPHAIALAA